MKRVHVQYYSVYSHIIEIALRYTKKQKSDYLYANTTRSAFYQGCDLRGILCNISRG